MIEATSVPPVGRREAAALATDEYHRLVELLRALPPEAWDHPTDCPEWRVREMVAHVLNALEASAWVREQVHQQRAARKVARPLVDALGEVQIRDRVGLTPEVLIGRLERAIAPGVRGRARIPAPLRALRLRVELPFGTERWPLAYLLDTIYLRDGGRAPSSRCRRVLSHRLGPGPGHRPSHRGGSVLMETRTHEIADGTYRFSTFVPDAGIVFNQFLVDAEEPCCTRGAPVCSSRRPPRPSSPVTCSPRWATAHRPRSTTSSGPRSRPRTHSARPR